MNTTAMTTSHYDLYRWQRQVWTSDTRVYIIELKQNLFGDWILVCAWRGKGQRGGQSQTRYAASYEAALDWLAHAERRRRARGYQLQTSESHPCATDL